MRKEDKTKGRRGREERGEREGGNETKGSRAKEGERLPLSYKDANVKNQIPLLNYILKIILVR